MRRFFDIDNPIFTQTHKKNEFLNSGQKTPVIEAIRHKCGYPAPGENRLYFGISKDGCPIGIVQSYAEPYGNRSADEISVFCMKEQNCEYDLEYFQELASDFLFGTCSAQIPYDLCTAIQTWILFVKAVSLNPSWRSYNFFIHATANPIDSIHKICVALDYESLKRTACISRDMVISTNSKLKAIQLATIDFTHPSKEYHNLHDIHNALNHLNECNYKTQGYLYLISRHHVLDETIVNYLRSNHDAQDILLDHYINALCANDVQGFIIYRSLMHDSTFRPRNLKHIENRILPLVQAGTANFEIHLELLFLCSMFNYGLYSDYVRMSMHNIRTDQLLRHQFLLFLHNHTEYHKILAHVECKGYSDEVDMIKGKYATPYIHDAYYLRLIGHKQYMRYHNSESVDYLSDLALYDFKCSKANSDDTIYEFFDYANARIRTKVKSAFKRKALAETNDEICSIFKSLKLALKKKIEVLSHLKSVL